MRLFNTVAALRHYLNAVSGGKSKTVGLVPTMGALHAGHLSLVAQARRDCDIVVVSIFVNPLQFGPNEDLDRYPRPADEDTALCAKAAVDAIFMPSPAELYGSANPDLDSFTQVTPPKSMIALLCGQSRPTHFQGVATVVTKLLNIVRPTFAYFGQKDAQQVAIIKRLIADLNLPGTAVACPIVREPDGLALSSRNRYLTTPQRQQALVLQRSLQATKAAFIDGKRSEQALRSAALQVLATEPDVILDYLTLVHPDTLKPLQTVDTVGMMAIAAHVGKARLLDNVVLSNSLLSKTDRTPIIAIDGPAGAGKSTVARQIAHALGLLYLDTGAMYRALTWFVLHKGIDPANEAVIAKLLPHCHIQLTASIEDEQPQPPQVSVNGKDVTDAIRSAEVTGQVSTIAAQAAVRSHLVQQQQQYGAQGGVVADGRDIGTHVFPDAELKIFLTASVEERAQRRYLDLKHANRPLPAIEDLTAAIAERDRKDSTRAVSPLKKAPDAIEIVTDDLSAEDVIEKITALYQQLTA